MKKRIKIDSSILSAVIIFTGVLFLFKKFYPQNLVVDNVLDFLGVVAILKGIILRMIARGHKKANSDKSESLVTSGIYQLTRNPMYLGTFLIGAGYVLVVWPWWSLPVFAALFYLRFNKEMVREEEFLLKKFPDEYTKYCQKVPRIFPRWKDALATGPSEIFQFKESLSTKERRGLFIWPLLAFGLDCVQELVVFGVFDLQASLIVFSSAIIFFLGFSLGIKFNKQVN